MNSLDKMEDYDRLKQERDELVALVEVMRDVCDAAASIDEFGTDSGCRLRLALKARNALTITPSAALREIQERTLFSLFDLTNTESGNGTWKVTLEYDNYHDGARVLDGDGNLLAECYDLDKEPNEQFLSAVDMAAAKRKE